MLLTSSIVLVGAFRHSSNSDSVCSFNKFAGFISFTLELFVSVCWLWSEKIALEIRKDFRLMFFSLKSLTSASIIEVFLLMKLAITFKKFCMSLLRKANCMSLDVKNENAGSLQFTKENDRYFSPSVDHTMKVW